MDHRTRRAVSEQWPDQGSVNPRMAGLVHDWSTAKRGIAKFPYETVGGEGGIRTRGGLLTLARFPGV